MDTILTCMPQIADAPECAYVLRQRAELCTTLGNHGLATTLRLGADHIDVLVARVEELTRLLSDIRNDLEMRKRIETCSPLQ